MTGNRLGGGGEEEIGIGISRFRGHTHNWRARANIGRWYVRIEKSRGLLRVAARLCLHEQSEGA